MIRHLTWVLALLVPAAAMAGPEHAGKEQARAARLIRYFDKAHKAVVGGGIPTYGWVKDRGLQVSCLVGLHAGLSEITTFDKGMQTKTHGYYYGATGGLQVGAGPEAATFHYLAYPNQKPEAPVLRKVRSDHWCNVVFMRPLYFARQGSNFGAGDYYSPLYVGLGAGDVTHKALWTEKPTKTPMLQRLEQGRSIGQSLAAKIKTGTWTSAESSAVQKMEGLHQQISSEKAQHNKLVRGYQRQLDSILTGHSIPRQYRQHLVAE